MEEVLKGVGDVGMFFVFRLMKRVDKDGRRVERLVAGGTSDREKRECTVRGFVWWCEKIAP